MLDGKSGLGEFARRLEEVVGKRNLSSGQVDRVLCDAFRVARRGASYLQAEGLDPTAENVRTALMRLNAPSFDELIARAERDSGVLEQAVEKAPCGLPAVNLSGKRMDRFDSKFRFVLVASQRAEQLMMGALPRLLAPGGSSVRTAMIEVILGLIDWDYGPASAVLEGPDPEGALPAPA